MSHHHYEARTALQDLVQEMANLRRRPCLLEVDPFIDPQSIDQLNSTLENTSADGIDLILHSAGGCSCCAYTFARQLRRRFAEVTVYVPLQAKSAATLLALVGSEIVFGELGELGPLDAQMASGVPTESNCFRSHLERMQALGQICDFTGASIGELSQRLGAREDLRGLDANQAAIDIVSKISGQLLSRIDPQALAESARQLETGADYARRILRRYRAEIPSEVQERLVATLVRAYPSHGFVIDLEECGDIGIPARAASGEESILMERIAVTLRCLDPSDAILGLSCPAPEVEVAREAQQGEPGLV